MPAGVPEVNVCVPACLLPAEKSYPSGGEVPGYTRDTAYRILGSRPAISGHVTQANSPPLDR
jgi:hypothetical protein